jgi:P-type E1-E2 ATPase
MMIQTGDILYLEKGEKAPVDAFILSTSIEDGTCFVDTAELDGETNLKRRTALQDLCGFSTISVISKYLNIGGE